MSNHRKGQMPSIDIFLANNDSDESVDVKADEDARDESDDNVVHLETGDKNKSDEDDKGVSDDNVVDLEEGDENKTDVADDDDGGEENKENKDDEEAIEGQFNEPNFSKELIKNIAADYELTKQDVDYNQYEKDCPSVCPAREVMLCAKCQHNIYRTFLSPCHLRVFNCKYPDEKLELMNRQPCMQSAPFLTNLPEAKGRISEPGDQDDILKFIYCRDKERLGKDDPRCNFEDDSKIKL